MSLPKQSVREADLVSLSAYLHALEAKMLTGEKLARMIDAPRFDEAARMAAECGYPDVSALDVFGIERALSAHRLAVYDDLARTEAAVPILDMFRVKYDYHNVKTLVKSMGANEDATRILSECGRVPSRLLTEAFISGERSDIPQDLRDAFHDGVSILSRTSNPQLSDISADRLYFAETLRLAEDTGNAALIAYARLLIDAANLRTFVRAKRTARPDGFLSGAIFDGGNAKAADILALSPAGENAASVFTVSALAPAAALAAETIAGKTQTAFERALDNAVYAAGSDTRYVPFGAETVLSYLLALDWEITSIRTALTGKLAGIAPELLRERVREGNV
ncbi:MAG: V-type ATPase subunit [Oscillospiraceae bacterium]|nr:V-type ATPase subunit [Oscillospiraceae bacterium]